MAPLPTPDLDAELQDARAAFFDAADGMTIRQRLDALECIAWIAYRRERARRGLPPSDLTPPPTYLGARIS